MIYTETMLKSLTNAELLRSIDIDTYNIARKESPATVDKYYHKSTKDTLVSAILHIQKKHSYLLAIPDDVEDKLSAQFGRRAAAPSRAADSLQRQLDELRLDNLKLKAEVNSLKNNVRSPSPSKLSRATASASPASKPSSSIHSMTSSGQSLISRLGGVRQ